MFENMPHKDIRTLGYVLRRTNYGEADRILNIITPLGKLTAIAKGVRKSKSKLAGGVEMFSLVDFNMHFGKSEFGIITGAKMIKHDGNIVKDFERLELAGMMFKKISKVAESSDSPDYFKIVDQSLTELNGATATELIEGWFLINVSKTMGEEVNLYRDINGDKLEANKTYNWDMNQAAFVESESGEYRANEIKLLRLMTTNDLKIVKKVKVDKSVVAKSLDLIRMVSQI